MNADSRFDRLINEALSQELVGWDFSWLSERTTETPLPWDFREIVLNRMKAATSLLDLGTGGGEFLASLAPLPANTWATEGYPPNINIAHEHLETFGVHVVDVSELGNALPFGDATFDLVIDRHTGCNAQEVYRVLFPGGRYLTQQVGGENCTDLNRFLQERPYFRYANTTLANEVSVFKTAGFQILNQREAFPVFTFLDIAGVVFYLKVISWQIEDFSVEKYGHKLFQIHQIIERDGGFEVREHRLLIEAEKVNNL
jgi:SAM-dependent methyltransferase